MRDGGCFCLRRQSYRISTTFGDSNATPALAQEEKGNVAVSYSILHDSDVSETFPMGWLFAVQGNVMPQLAIVGEVGGNYKTVDVFGTDLSLRVHSFMGGIKFQGPSPKATGFAQFLVGGVSGSASILGESDSGTAIAFQPGGGVDIKLTPAVGLRVQGDYRILRDEGESSSEFRFAVGAVFGFGK
jgi:hypothetical protein